MKQAMIFDIQHGSFVDGPGIRTVVFFKGCNMSCRWCHNPESQSSEIQKLFYRERCIECGKCRQVCPSPEHCNFCGTCALFCPQKAITICGRLYTVEEVMEEILADRLFYDSDGGVTFSGGECMLQLDFLTEVLRSCKEQGIHTAVDTAGNVSFEAFMKVMPYTDVFLYDIKCASEELHKEYTGVSNRLILDNLYRLKEKGARIIIRVPLIPDINTSTEELEAIRVILDMIGPELTEILSYHKMGLEKAVALGWKQKEFRSPTDEELALAKKILLH